MQLSAPKHWLKRLKAANESRSPTNLWCSAIALLFALLPLIDHPGVVELCAFLGIIIALSINGRHTYLQTKASIQAEADLTLKQANDEKLRKLISPVIAFWQTQSESVKSQIEKAGLQIIDHFGLMITEFDSSGFGGVSGQGDSSKEKTAINLIAMCEKELQLMQNSLLINKTSTSATDAITVDKEVINQIGQMVSNLSDFIGALAGSANEMRGHGKTIRVTLEAVMVSLQYQDRVTQILEVINQDMTRLQTLLVESGQGQYQGQELPSPNEWISGKSSSFKRHYGILHAADTNKTSAKESEQSSIQGASDSSDVTFF